MRASTGSTPTSSMSRWTIAASSQTKITSHRWSAQRARCRESHDRARRDQELRLYYPPTFITINWRGPRRSWDLTCPSPSASWALTGPCARTTSAAFLWWASSGSTAACAVLPMAVLWPAKKAFPTSSCLPPTRRRGRGGRQRLSGFLASRCARPAQHLGRWPIQREPYRVVSFSEELLGELQVHSQALGQQTAKRALEVAAAGSRSS